MSNNVQLHFLKARIMFLCRQRLLALSRLSPLKECCQQIVGLDDESFSIAVCIDAKKKSVFGKMLGDACKTSPVRVTGPR